MRTLKLLILLGVLSSQAALALTGPVSATDNVKSRLVSETGSIAPGQSIWVALELNIREGWHTYWKNPGDSGQATTLAWTLPPGFVAGEIVWPTPHRFDLPPLVNYGYATHVLHLVQVAAPRDLKPGAAVVLSAKASYLVCSDVCIPEDASLELKMPSSAEAGQPDPAETASFSAARAALPSPAPAPLSARVQSGNIVISLGREWGATLSQIESLTFFAADAGSIEYAAPQTLTRAVDSVDLTMKAGDTPPTSGAVHGVLVATERNGTGKIAVPMNIAAGLSGPGASAAAAQTEKAVALPSLIGLAILGGLILNLMPCVFPVLTIKAMGLVEQSKKSPAAVRAKGLIFASGVIASMLTLATVLLLLRAGGEQIGWGFQLQSPLFVTLMVYLLLAVGLNLSGVFEVGGTLAGVGDELTQGDGYRASFFTGVLTTLVATPCTAPFMAAAVGAALTQSPAVALTIFASLGAGLSLPYLLLSFAPWTRRVLPRPGAWMDTLKQAFAFPIYASAAWLLWVLAQQTSPLGLGAALAGVIFIALAAWAYQKSTSSSSGARGAALTTAVISVLLALVLPVRLSGEAPRPGAVASAAEADPWQPYDAAKLAALDAGGRPVLVNFTASWCLTCLVNERNAFADSAVQEVFTAKGVTLMKGDWTSRDPVITRALAAFGRAGVPLYLAYNARSGSADPIVLPQLLTAGVVRDTFTDLPNRILK